MNKLPCNCHYCCIKATNQVICDGHPEFRLEPYCKRYHCYLSKVIPNSCPKHKDYFEFLANTFCRGTGGDYLYLPAVKFVKDCMLYLEQEYRFFFYDSTSYDHAIAFIETKKYIIDDLLDIGYIKKNPYPWIDDIDALLEVAIVEME